jgi:hypothetical protein
MNDTEIYYEKGKKACSSAESFARSSKFPQSLAIEMIASAVEYLLKSILEKRQVFTDESGITSFYYELKNHQLAPDEVLKAIKLLSLGCSTCSLGTEAQNQFELPLLISRMNLIKSWVDSEIAQ